MTAPAATSDVRIIGRYALHEEIAAGGMATVHLGRLLGPAGFSRTVAIKRLHAQYARDPEFTSMFLDEARLAARIRHPNVVSTLDVVALEGELFIVMDYVEGESLSRLIRVARDTGQQIPMPIAIAVMAGVLYGVHGAHEAKGEHGELLGLVHRDVSPQNILVDTDGVPRVVDFGVAKAVGRLQTTRDGQLKGKLAYMAPEQLRGHKVDGRTDVFAASVVLWELLTSKRLFQGDNEAETFGKILECDIPAPSSIAPGVPPEIDAIVLRGLAAKPDDRWESALDMAEALERATRDRPTQRDIGRWVRSVADDSLAKRAAKVRELESHSAVNELVGAGSPLLVSPAASVPLATIGQPAPPTVVDRPPFEESAPTDVAPTISEPVAPTVPATVAPTVPATVASPVQATMASPVQATVESPVQATMASPVQATMASPVQATMASPVVPEPVGPFGAQKTMTAVAPAPAREAPAVAPAAPPRPPAPVADDEPTLHSESKVALHPSPASIETPPLATADSSGSFGAVVPAQSTTDERSGSGVSSIALERSKTAAPPPGAKKALIPLAIGAAGLLALLLVVALAFLLGGRGEEEASESGVVAIEEPAKKPAAAPKPTPAPEPVAPPIVPLTPPSASAAPAESVVAKSAAPAPSNEPGKPPPAAKKPVVKSGATPKGNCSPPYTLDKDGTRIPKLECL